MISRERVHAGRLQARAIVRRTTAPRPPSENPKNADRLDLFRPFLESGLSLLAAAGWIIEKELSIGIEIAKFVEARIPRVGALRDGMPKVVGVAAGVIRTTVRLLTGGAGGIVSFSVKPPARPTQGTGETCTVLKMPGPLSPGQTGERVLLLNNESVRPTTEFTLGTSDLLSAAGGRIAADCVRFEPATLSVAAHSTSRVVVGIIVPKNTPSGSYEGQLRGAGLENQGSLLRVDIA